MNVRHFIPLAACIALAACSGGGGSSTPSAAGGSSSGASSAMQSLSSVGSSFPDAKSVSVKPDTVDLTLANPTQSVTVKGPKGTTFTEKDTCTSKGIATITASGTDTYAVTAGLTGGKCTATFSGKDASGKKVGSAKLKVDNTV